MRAKSFGLIGAIGGLVAIILGAFISSPITFFKVLTEAYLNRQTVIAVILIIVSASSIVLYGLWRLSSSFRSLSQLIVARVIIGTASFGLPLLLMESWVDADLLVQEKQCMTDEAKARQEDRVRFMEVHYKEAFSVCIKQSTSFTK